MEVARNAALEVPEVCADGATLQHLLAKRLDKTRAYFDELAGRFGKDYVPGRSWKALAEALLKVMDYKVVADLGAGEGTLLNCWPSARKRSLQWICLRKWSSSAANWRENTNCRIWNTGWATSRSRQSNPVGWTWPSSVKRCITPNTHSGRSKPHS